MGELASDFYPALYFYPGTACLRNEFGMTDADRMAEIASIVSQHRIEQLERTGIILGDFDAIHLCEINYRLFRDIYPWAGMYRLLEPAKLHQVDWIKTPREYTGLALRKARTGDIRTRLDSIFEMLANEKFLTGMKPALFAERAAFYMAEIDDVHPFMDGNGRTQREFIRQLALQAGHRISWSNYQRDTMKTAFVVDDGGLSKLATLVRKAMVQSPVVEGTCSPSDSLRL